ncbi:sigma-70 family RNA polymerase sigma factor [Clostridium sp. DL1XJH146]
MEKLLKKAKGNDDQAIEQIISDYMPLVIKESSKYKIKGYDFEDIVQHNILSIIKSVKIYEAKGESFEKFVEENIKLDNFNLYKRKMKHNREIQNRYPFENLEEKYIFTVEEQSMAYDLSKKINRNVNYNKIIRNIEIGELKNTAGM